MARIEANNLCVDFPIAGGIAQMGKSLVQRVGGNLAASPASGDRMIVQAINDLNFTIESGDRIGIIGHNGAGKSTLLQVLNGGIHPSYGSVDVEGRVIPLLNLGNGVDREFSGYENIVLLGLHLGLTRKEIEKRIEDIVTFSELGDYIHLPMRSYSAGMHLRLAFSIATSVDPDILLVDELFGAGDQSFYAKARKRMEQLVERAGILVFSTHSMGLIADYCSRVFVMESGRIIFDGPPQAGIAHYQSLRKGAA